MGESEQTSIVQNYASDPSRTFVRSCIYLTIKRLEGSFVFQGFPHEPSHAGDTELTMRGPSQSLHADQQTRTLAPRTQSPQE